MVAVMVAKKTALLRATHILTEGSGFSIDA
jgi:hypothetical protein